ncbi:MAG: FliM/FliN family flagellar motor switch protein [bacterium]
MDSEESNEMNEERKTENDLEVETTSPAEGVETPEEQSAAEATTVTDEDLPDEKADQNLGEKAGVLSEMGQEEGLDEVPEAIPQSPEPALTEDRAAQDCGGDEPFSEQRIQRILDIELPVNISFGSTRRPLSEVLKLGPGALLELDRDADDPVILKVNNRVFAKGEIVDVDGYYGVQISEISTPAHRIASLGDKA